MEIMYPLVIIICLALSLFIYFKNFNKEKYTSGKKVANTKYVKETEYYKKKLREYKIFSTSVKVLSVAIIIVTSILIARPVTVQRKSEDKLNRDIMIGLDISTSECEVNLELIKQFKAIIPNIEGDRIGIVLYNTAPIVYCPLTDDYDYINECLDEIEKQLEFVVKNEGNIPLYEITDEEEEYKAFTFWYGGTVANSDIRGSSLVGDGLAGTVFSFPNLEKDKDRTRIILFATDNDVAGSETVTLPEAATLCKRHNINIYAYCPSKEMNVYTSDDKIASYKKAIEQNAGGKFYTGDLTKMASTMVGEIKDTKTSLLKTSKKTFVTDHPEVFFMGTVTIFIISIIMEKKIKL